MDNNSKAVVVGRRMIKFFDSMINFVMLSLCLLLLLYGVYVLLYSESVYRAADASVYSMYRPVAEEVDGGPSFSELQGINSDVFAWLTVYGTNIDYPVVHTDNNDTYINTDAMGEYSLSGSLFLDYNNAPGFSDFSSIIYGHHMEKSTMFGELASFQDDQYFDDHEYGELFFDGQDHGIRFFAFLEADAYDSTVYRTDIPAGEEEAYVAHLLAVSTNSRAFEIKQGDRIVLLSTCTSGSSTERHILAGVITQDTYTNSFAVSETGGAPVKAKTTIKTTDWINWQLLLSPVILILLIVLYLLCGIVRRARYENNH